MTQQYQLIKLLIRDIKLFFKILLKIVFRLLYFRDLPDLARRMAEGGDSGEWAAIGIDLGMMYSCVAVWQHDRVEVIVNDQGNRTMPSYVASTDKECLVSDAAQNQVARNLANFVFGNLPPFFFPLFPLFFSM
jgi:hypothetical protein